MTYFVHVKCNDVKMKQTWKNIRKSLASNNKWTDYIRTVHQEEEEEFTNFTEMQLNLWLWFKLECSLSSLTYPKKYFWVIEMPALKVIEGPRWEAFFLVSLAAGFFFFFVSVLALVLFWFVSISSPCNSTSVCLMSPQTKKQGWSVNGFGKLFPNSLCACTDLHWGIVPKSCSSSFSEAPQTCSEEILSGRATHWDPHW